MNIINQAPSVCIFRDKGCMKTMPFGQLAEHEAQCDYSDVNHQKMYESQCNSLEEERSRAYMMRENSGNFNGNPNANNANINAGMNVGTPMAVNPGQFVQGPIFVQVVPTPINASAMPVPCSCRGINTQAFTFPS